MTTSKFNVLLIGLWLLLSTLWWTVLFYTGTHFITKYW